MKTNIFVFVSISFLFTMFDNQDSEVRGCVNKYAINYNAEATIDCKCCELKQGDVIFWAADSSSVLSTCGFGDRTITLTDKQTGMERTNIGFTVGEVANCDTTQAGHFRTNVGSYSFVLTGDYLCDRQYSGSVVIKEGCNKIQLDAY